MGASSPQYNHDSAPQGRPVPAPPAAPQPARAEESAPFGLVDQLPGAVLLLDPAGRVVHLNGIAELRLGLGHAEAVGRDLFRGILPELEGRGVGAQYRAGMAAGRASLTCEVTFERSSVRHRLGLGIRSYVHQGHAGGVVLLEDRSALAEEEARRKRAEQLAAVGELATGVAHEVNNPLASIKGFAQLLARDATAEGQVQGLEIISQECTRVAQIIDRLLDFSVQQRTCSYAPLDLSALVDGVMDLRKYGLETVGIQTERELDRSLSPVQADRGALQRVVLALLRQAERSLGSDDPGRRLIVRTRESTDGVVLYVIDNGRGIPRERLRTLLTAIGPDEYGDGMGLSDALDIVREHGGHLWAESVEGEGTAFFLRLPRAAEIVGAPQQALLPASSMHSVPRRPLRVLVADDEPTLRLALALFLGRHGHEVVQAADAYEAQRLALAEPFDAVLADAHMPGDGLGLLERLEAIPRLKGRTILMTGDHFPALTADGSANRPHLAKPFDMTEAIRLVETLGR
ncbi:MAG: response regulator [Gemmatimonadetes bacterium]|nr:response regulator [Gemmatimonadota bacterium]